MVGRIGTARQAHGLALAAAAALMLTSGTAFAQLGTNPAALSAGANPSAESPVGPTGLGFGATQTGGGGLSPEPSDTTSAVGALGSNVSSTMGMSAPGAAPSGNAALSPMPTETTSALPSAGTGVMGAVSSGALGLSSSTAGTMSGGLTPGPLVPSSGVAPFESTITGGPTMAGAGTTASGLSGTASTLGVTGATSQTGVAGGTSQLGVGAGMGLP
ncbi:MAG TPA: hypothetical protein VE650_08860 [Acetobacteraceae bacterium]|nr:hypothetical protein [Acetobacteraceae bacterium]